MSNCCTLSENCTGYFITTANVAPQSKHSCLFGGGCDVDVVCCGDGSEEMGDRELKKLGVAVWDGFGTAKGTITNKTCHLTFNVWY